MRLQKTLIWVFIVIVGFPIGYFLRDRLNKHDDRDQAALSLFLKYCVPLVRGQLVPPNDQLTQLTSLKGTAWAEPETVMLLRISNDECSISDVLQPMNQEERQDLDGAVARVIERELPALKSDRNHGLDDWAAFLVWESHPRGDKKRWGVVFSRVSSEADSETTLSLRYPKNDDVSKNLLELQRGL